MFRKQNSAPVAHHKRQHKQKKPGPCIFWRKTYTEFTLQMNLFTPPALGTEESSHCRGVASMER